MECRTDPLGLPLQIRKFDFCNITKVFQMIELRGNFSGGTFRYPQKLNEFLVSPAFKSFSDVRTNGYGGSLNLISQTKVL